MSRDRILEDSYRAIMSLKRTDVLKARYCNRVRAADFEIIAPDGDQLKFLIVTMIYVSLEDVKYLHSEGFRRASNHILQTFSSHK